MTAVRRQVFEDAAPQGNSLNPGPEHRGSAQDPNGAAPDGDSEAFGVDYSRWAALVDQIREGDEHGMEELYAVFSRGIRFYLCRHLGAQELDDKIHDTFLIVVQAIRRGDLREPERLMGFVRTVARRQVAAHIDGTVHRRKDQTDIDTGLPVPDTSASPEDAAIARQRVEIMKEALQEISKRDREILTRFYLDEQSQKQICREMHLSATQFRLLKSRAKARFGEIGRKRLARRPLSRILLRVSDDPRH